MKNTYQEKLNEFNQKLAALKAQSASGDSSDGTIIAAAILALVGPSTEWDLICYMQEKNVWVNSTTSPVQPPNYASGLPIEFGLFLYWIYNPPLLVVIKYGAEITAIQNELSSTYGITGSQMTLANYDVLGSTTSSLIYTDGSVLNRKTYAAYDMYWFVAFFVLYETADNNIFYNGFLNFPIASPAISPITATGATANTIKIALMGDWGTGDTTAAGVMNQITALNPDYIVHLGDVYYAGTPQTGDPNASFYPSAVLNEEQNNLLAGWPAAYNGKSFTLNSNHEMYSGANGYFYDALGIQNGVSSSPFSAQQGYSYFALSVGDWTILGLDSAFMSNVLEGFMNGSIGGATGPQGQWITSLGLDPSKTIVFTHHNGIAYDASAAESLWAEIGTVNGALGGDPYAWYWGHVHNAFAYNSPVNAGSFSTATYARCAGHGALPYGFANGVTQVAYQADSVQPNGQLYNGFVMLQIQLSNGTVTNIREAFYDQSNYNSGSPANATSPIWTNTLFNS